MLLYLSVWIHWLFAEQTWTMLFGPPISSKHCAQRDSFSSVLIVKYPTHPLHFWYCENVEAVECWRKKSSRLCPECAAVATSRDGKIVSVSQRHDGWAALPARGEQNTGHKFIISRMPSLLSPLAGGTAGTARFRFMPLSRDRCSRIIYCAKETVALLLVYTDTQLHTCRETKRKYWILFLKLLRSIFRQRCLSHFSCIFYFIAWQKLKCFIQPSDFCIKIYRFKFQ